MICRSYEWTSKQGDIHPFKILRFPSFLYHVSLRLSFTSILTFTDWKSVIQLFFPVISFHLQLVCKLSTNHLQDLFLDYFDCFFYFFPRTVRTFLLTFFQLINRLNTRCRKLYCGFRMELSTPVSERSVDSQTDGLEMN